MERRPESRWRSPRLEQRAHQALPRFLGRFQLLTCMHTQSRISSLALVLGLRFSTSVSSSFEPFPSPLINRSRRHRRLPLLLKQVAVQDTSSPSSINLRVPLALSWELSTSPPWWPFPATTSPNLPPLSRLFRPILLRSKLSVQMGEKARLPKKRRKEDSTRFTLVRLLLLWNLNY